MGEMEKEEKKLKGEVYGRLEEGEAAAGETWRTAMLHQPLGGEHLILMGAATERFIFDSRRVQLVVGNRCWCPRLGSDPVLQAQKSFALARALVGGAMQGAYPTYEAFSFLKGGEVFPQEQYDRYLSASRQHGVKPVADDTGPPSNLPPIKDVDPSAVNAFFASDILSEISKQEPPVVSQPESTSKSKTLPNVSEDADFYASDALSQLEQESKRGKGN
ncbi:hypothetical protein BDP67DRAFT_570427 [Colletotrichum lupini]|nr:hypothetical protein BDP67DRAFT_570427 [Colletotrichum lupini]